MTHLSFVGNHRSLFHLSNRETGHRCIDAYIRSEGTRLKIPGAKNECNCGSTEGHGVAGGVRSCCSPGASQCAWSRRHQGNQQGRLTGTAGSSWRHPPPLSPSTAVKGKVICLKAIIIKIHVFKSYKYNKCEKCILLNLNNLFLFQLV